MSESNEIFKEHPRVETNTHEDSFYGKAMMEVQLLKEGVSSGFANRTKEALQNPGDTALQVGTAASIGAGLNLLSRSGSRECRLAAKLGGYLITAYAVGDAAQRVGTTGSAMIDTWNAPQRFDQNKLAVAGSLGSACFDYPLFALSGAAGSYGVKKGSEYFQSRNNPMISEGIGATNSPQDLKTMQAILKARGTADSAYGTIPESAFRRVMEEGRQANPRPIDPTRMAAEVQPRQIPMNRDPAGRDLDKAFETFREKPQWKLPELKPFELKVENFTVSTPRFVPLYTVTASLAATTVETAHIKKADELEELRGLPKALEFDREAMERIRTMETPTRKYGTLLESRQTSKDLSDTTRGDTSLQHEIQHNKN